MTVAANAWAKRSACSTRNGLSWYGRHAGSTRSASPAAFWSAATYSYASQRCRSRAGYSVAASAPVSDGVSPSATASRPKALPSHLLYGAYIRSSSRHSRIRSRTSRPATTADPRSSPASAHRPTNASSWEIRCHWQASRWRHTWSGYQARRARAAPSVPSPSWNTAPPVISASRCWGMASQSRTDGAADTGVPSRPRSQPPTSSTETRWLTDPSVNSMSPMGTSGS